MLLKPSHIPAKIPMAPEMIIKMKTVVVTIVIIAFLLLRLFISRLSTTVPSTELVEEVADVGGLVEIKGDFSVSDKLTE